MNKMLLFALFLLVLPATSATAQSPSFVQAVLASRVGR